MEVYILGGILLFTAYVFVVFFVLQNVRSSKQSGLFMLLLYFVTLAFLFDDTPAYKDSGGSKECENEKDYDYTQVIDGFDYDYDFTD